MDRFLIYGLVDPTTGQLRYVGRSSSGLERPRRHIKLSNQENTHKARWIRCLSGLEPQIVVIQNFKDPAMLNQAEIHWIAYFRAMGCPLTNLTDGGDGCSGYKQSELHKAKRAAKHIGATRTEKTKIRMSRAKGVKPIIDDLGRIFLTQSEASKKLGIHQVSISKVLRGVLNQTHGRTFRYLENDHV